MKLKPLLLIGMLLLLYFVGTASSAETIWTTGRVSTSVSEYRYNTILYYQFNFTLMDANVSLSFGSDITVIMPESLTVAPQLNSVYNFTGYMVSVQTDEIPAGYFVVEEVNTQVNVDWIDAVFQFVSICASVVSLIANAISVLVYTYSGFQIPTLLITVGIILVALYSALKHWKAIGILLGIVCIFLVFSGFLNLIRLAWLGSAYV
jgi:hypothetical protein